MLAGHARPDGLAAVAYHGLIAGMTLLAGSAPTDRSVMARSTAAITAPCNPELLRVLANMVLQTQSEVRHVY